MKAIFSKDTKIEKWRFPKEGEAIPDPFVDEAHTTTIRFFGMRIYRKRRLHVYSRKQPDNLVQSV